MSFHGRAHAPAALATAIILSLGYGCAQTGGDGESSGDASAPAPKGSIAQNPWDAPEGFEPMRIPEDNPISRAKVKLGELLYYDARLSGDGSRSCYSCHVCESGLTDGRPTAIGAFEKKLTRSSPSMWNIGFHDEFYWDGRAPSLEKQVAAAWKGGNMGAKDKIADVVATLNSLPGYQKMFMVAFESEATEDLVVQAIASYVRTIICADTPYDRWRLGDADAIPAEAKRGYELFAGKARCTECHKGVLFSDGQYHNVGIGMDAASPDVGRYKVTQKDENMGAFKTPTVRDITRSAPYFHNGSVESLAEAVRLMLSGGIDNPHIDSKLQKVELSASEFADLLNFLGTLECPCDAGEPDLP